MSGLPSPQFWVSREIRDQQNERQYEQVLKSNNKLRPNHPEKAWKCLDLLCHDEKWLLQSNLEIQELISDDYSFKYLNKPGIICTIPLLSEVTFLSFPMLCFLRMSSLFPSTNTATANCYSWFIYQGIITLQCLSNSTLLMLLFL